MNKLGSVNLCVDICGHGFLWTRVMLSLAQTVALGAAAGREKNPSGGGCCVGEAVPRTLLGMELCRL